MPKIMCIKVRKQYQVGGHTYSVILNKGLQDSGDYGQVNHRTQEIEINPLRPESQKAEALGHELLHIINNVYADGRLSEGDVGALSQGLYQVFQQLGVKLDWQDIPFLKTTKATGG